MKITEIRTTPIFLPYKIRYHWAQGTIDGAELILVEVHTDEGITGYGESVGSPSAGAIEAHLAKAAGYCIGHDPFENSGLMHLVYQALFQAMGTCSSPRYAGQVLAGLEMALWDVMGKATGKPAHQLLGGARRNHVQYFGFPQGDTAEELAAGAKALADDGCEVIYVKVGRGDALDLEIVAKVREAIGNRRLRLDPNEHWDPLTAGRMIPQVAAYGIEFIEQPTSSESINALLQVKGSSAVAIAADQSAFTPSDVFEVCRRRAADMIVLGLHETGGLTRFCKAAHIAEAAGINICLHGLYESGITTCASIQAAAAIANLDDGNQYMNHFLVEDIVAAPDLALNNGQLPVFTGPGLGFELDEDAVARAAEAHRKQFSA